MRRRRLQFLLENNEHTCFALKSFRGLMEDLPDLYERYRELLEQVGDYETLDQLVNHPDEMDRDYMVWVAGAARRLPALIPVQEEYDENDLHGIHRSTGIPLLILMRSPDSREWQHGLR